MTEPNGAAAQPFEPTRFISKVGGSDYLEVKWRLVWLRDSDPDATIDTELIRADDKSATFKATIQRTSGGRATGYGSETAGDFRDFLEKAETKAIGRALAALGFGTQFCADHDFGSARGRVVDSPVNRTRQARTESARPETARPQAGAAESASDRQHRYLHAVARETGATAEELDRRAQREYNTPTAQQLSRRDRSDLIDTLQREAGTPPIPPAAPPPTGRTNTEERPDRSPKVTNEHITALHAAGARAFPKDKGETLHARVKGQARAYYGATSLKELTQYQSAQLVAALNDGRLLDEPPS